MEIKNLIFDGSNITVELINNKTYQIAKPERIIQVKLKWSYKIK